VDGRKSSSEVGSGVLSSHRLEQVLDLTVFGLISNESNAQLYKLVMSEPNCLAVTLLILEFSFLDPCRW
jgi:hypothetical protein